MKKLLWLLFAIGWQTLAYAQQHVSGTVKNANTQLPLSDASVHLSSSKNVIRTALTNEKGEFNFKNLNNGDYTLTVSFIGFKNVTQTIVVNGNSVSDLVLLAEPATVLNGEALVQATRAKENSATTFTNINKQELAKQNHGQDLPFLLNLTPSTVINSDAGAGIGYTGIRIRGIDPTRTNVTINGVPVNDAESHGTFWVNTPDLASSVENIQVQRGVGTSTNGAAAFGASINIQTDGLSHKPFAEISNSFGSFNTRKHTVKFGTGLLDNGWAFDLRLSKLNSDGFIDRASSDLKSFFTSASRYGKKSLFKVNVFSGKEVTYQAWNGIPEPRVRNDVPGMIEYAALLGTDLDHLLKSGNRTYNEFTYKNQVDNYQQDHYQMFYTYLPNKYLKLNVGSHYTYGRGYYEEFKPGERLSKYKLNDVIIGSDTVRRSDIIRRRWLDNDFYGVVFSALYEKNKLTATFGGGANVYEGGHFGELVWSQYASNSFLGTRFYDGNSTKKEVNFYGKANYQFTYKLSSFVDLQVRSINYDLKGVDLNGSSYNPYDFNLNYFFFNPKAGLSYAFNQRTNIYAYFGIANREPERKDIIQAPVNNVPTSERLFNYELGFRKRMNKFSVEANAYYMDYKNQLVNTGQINDVGAYNRVNVSSSYRAGIELAGGVQLTKKIRWQATATFSQNRIKQFTEYVDDWDNWTQVSEVHNNKKIGFSPDWIASSVLSYTPLKQMQIDLITKYVSEQYLDNTENANRKLNAFLVNDIRLNYELPVTYFFNSIRVGVLVNNIFNEVYEPNGYTFSGITGGKRYDFNYYYPQAGTNLLANIILRF